MISKILITVLTAIAVATPATAYLQFGCNNRLIDERADPIIRPGKVSAHAHKIVGGSGFGLTMDYAQARSSKCSSCPIKADLSNYWTPKLYFQYANGSFQSVPTVGDSMADQNGGMTVYYLQRGPAADSKTLLAFPEGFRMVAGDPFKRANTGDFAADAVSYHCLGRDGDETNGFPDFNCPSGLRAQIFFPSCWDGKNLDSADHKSHMAYPASGKYNDGPCPSSHPKQMISLFYEVLYDTNQFANEWHGNTQPFVFAQGDPTGYGFHGDFVNGWDVDILQQVVDTCDNLADHGDLATCAVIANQLYTEKEQNRCRLESTTNEQVTGLLDSLPGCNPVFVGPGRAPTNPVCNEQPVSSKASPTSKPRGYKDITSSKNRAYIGCASDSTDNDSRTFSDKTTIYSADAAREMTVEYCADFCSGYTYAGVEYGTQCFCGNSLPADRAPLDGILGDCNMKCAGDQGEICGGSEALSVYKSCASGSECKNLQ